MNIWLEYEKRKKILRLKAKDHIEYDRGIAEIVKDLGL